MKPHNTKQGTPEWFELRRGRFTASEIYKLTAEPRKKADKEAGKMGGTAMSYVLEKVHERLSGQVKDEVFSKALEWGKENEPIAIERYEQLTGNKVREVGFLTYGNNAGASADGLVGFDGMIEVKCPYSDYLNRILEDVTENKQYYLQIQMGMMVANRDWCDYIIFDPRMPKGQDIVIQRVARDESAIQLIEQILQKAEKWAKIWEAEARDRFAKTLKLAS